MTPARRPAEQPHNLPTSAPLVPFIDAAFRMLPRRPLEQQRHALNTAMTAFSLGEKIRLTRTQLADLTDTLTRHKLRQETAHWFQPENPNDLKNTQYRLTERACVFLWLSGLLRHLKREEHWNSLEGNEQLKKFLKTTVEDHKERADGTGPAEKSGREISLFGRILAVAEAFDRAIANQLNRVPRQIRKATAAVDRQKTQGRLDPEVVSELSRIMGNDQEAGLLSGLKPTDRQGETKRISHPEFLSKETETKYPTARFIGAALRSLQGISQEKRHEVYQIGKVAHVLARRFKLNEEDREAIVRELRTHGLSGEAEHFVEPIGDSGKYRLTPFGTVLGLVLPSFLKQAASRRRSAIEEIEGKQEYRSFFQKLLEQQEQEEGDPEAGSTFASMLRLFSHVGNITLKRDFRLKPSKPRILDELEDGGESGQFHAGFAEQASKIIKDPAVFNQLIGVIDRRPYRMKLSRSEVRTIRDARKNRERT